MLVADSIYRHFSGVVALDGASLEIDKEEIVGIIGPNGSGKSTLLNVLSGFDRPDSGTVLLGGQRIEGRTPWKISGMGMRRTFQVAGQPQKLSAMEVMLTGAALPLGNSLLASIGVPGRVSKEQAKAVDRAFELLCILGLEKLANHPAGSLSGGQQKLLALGAVLMETPRVLLLDEPVAGVNPTLRLKIVEVLKELPAQGCTVVIVEHDMGFIRDLCSRAYVLDAGAVVACLPPDELASDPRVVEAYLGTASVAAVRPATEGEGLR